MYICVHTGDGSIGGFGKKDGGCLGLKNGVVHDGSPVGIPFDDPVETADCGLQYTMIVSSEHDIFIKRYTVTQCVFRRI
jgi:hypothetical protein